MGKSIPQKIVCHSSYLVFGLVGYGMLPPLVRPIEAAWDLSHSRMGVLLGMGNVVYAVASIIAGVFYDRFGARLVMAIAMAIAAVGAGCMAGAPVLWAFAAGLMIFVTGNATMQVVNPLVSKLYEPHSGRGIGLLHAFQSIGRLLAPMLVVACLATFGSWQATLVVSAGIFAAWMFLCLTVLRGPGMPVRDGDGEGFDLHRAARLLRDGNILLALACFVLASAGEGIALFWTANFLETERAFPRNDALYCLAAMMVGATIVRVGMGLLPRLVGGREFIALTAVVTVPAYALLTTATGLPAALGACLVLGLALGAYWPVLAAAALGYAPHGHGALTGLFILASCLAIMCGNALAGWLGDYVSLHTALAATPACALLFATGYWRFLAITRHRPA